MVVWSFNYTKIFASFIAFAWKFLEHDEKKQCLKPLQNPWHIKSPQGIIQFYVENTRETVSCFMFCQFFLLGKET